MQLEFKLCHLSQGITKEEEEEEGEGWACCPPCSAVLRES